MNDAIFTGNAQTTLRMIRKMRVPVFDTMLCSDRLHGILPHILLGGILWSGTLRLMLVDNIFKKQLGNKSEILKKSESKLHFNEACRLTKVLVSLILFAFNWIMDVTFIYRISKSTLTFSVTNIRDISSTNSNIMNSTSIKKSWHPPRWMLVWLTWFVRPISRVAQYNFLFIVCYKTT